MSRMKIKCEKMQNDTDVIPEINESGVDLLRHSASGAVEPCCYMQYVFLCVWV